LNAPLFRKAIVYIDDPSKMTLDAVEAARERESEAPIKLGVRTINSVSIHLGYLIIVTQDISDVK
jgi:hypothetical protein